VKRLDLTHPVISGNKWYKLRHNLTAAREQGHHTLLSFGGAYSNHIHALAGAGKQFGFNTIGVIRGEPYAPLNPTLQYAVEQGMQLHYLNRVDYRNKHTLEIIETLRQRFGNFYLLPEGGSNMLAVKGVSELVAELPGELDVLACACGTGATLAGLIHGLAGDKQALGVAVLKGAGFLEQDIQMLLQQTGNPPPQNWRLALDYHCGGYAKTIPELLAFIHEFEARHQLPLEPTYTGKLMWALMTMVERGEFPRGTTLVALHSGGLQGRRRLCGAAEAGPAERLA